MGARAGKLLARPQPRHQPCLPSRHIWTRSVAETSPNYQESSPQSDRRTEGEIWLPPWPDGTWIPLSQRTRVISAVCPRAAACKARTDTGSQAPVSSCTPWDVNSKSYRLKKNMQVWEALGAKVLNTKLWKRITRSCCGNPESRRVSAEGRRLTSTTLPPRDETVRQTCLGSLFRH